jgi:hypothetical protein
MRLRRASVIGSSLLAWAATASAECGWVLWYRVTEYPTGGAVEGPFRTEEAYPTFAACQAGLEEHLDGWAAVEEKDPDHKTTKRPNHVLVQDKNSLRAQRLHALRCFPDTVDPRGAKGGGR